MRKGRRVVLIENPVRGVGYTSLRRAKDYVERGRAEWVVEGAVVRFVPLAVALAEVRMERERAGDEAYWRAIVRERGGGVEEKLHCVMGVRRSYPSGMPGVELRPCLVSTKTGSG